jgi:hypothetical protein
MAAFIVTTVSAARRSVAEAVFTLEDHAEDVELARGFSRLEREALLDQCPVRDCLNEAGFFVQVLEITDEGAWGIGNGHERALSRSSARLRVVFDLLPGRRLPLGLGAPEWLRVSA